MKTSFISLLKYPRCLGYLVAFLAVALFSVPALAQDHGVGVGKSCPTATKVGDLASCTMSVANEDEYGDTLEIHEFWDLVGMGMDQFRNPPMGNLPIVAIDDPVVCPDGTMAEITCAMGDGPIGLVFPCEMGGCATPPGGNGSMLAVTVMSEYIVPDGSEDPLLDQANVIVDDMCDAPDTIGCNPNPQQQQFGAAVSLFEPSIAVTKTGPPSAKVGDEIIYTVIVEDTSTGTGFPGFENCVVTDDRAGGPFPIEPGVPFDYPYVVDPDDPDPLVNIATVTCDVVGFDNVEDGEAEWSVGLFEPSIAVTKTGPPSAKVGDEIIYTVIVEDTSTGSGFPGFENCVLNDSLAGGPFPIEPGVPFDYPYVVQPGPDPLLNEAIVTCDVIGFDNEVPGSATHEVGLFEPDIEVDKTGPPIAKAGDEIIYTVIVEDTSTGSGFPGFENCVVTDDRAGGPFPIEPGVPFDYSYVVQPDDPDPLVNIATVTCDVIGFDNQESGSAEHTVDLRFPDAELSKVCRPDPVLVGDTIEWEVTICNTGDTGLVCELSDPVAGCDEILPVPPGECEVCTGSRTVEEGDAPAIFNTATAVCDVDDFDNEIELEASAECEVDVPAELCRTPGFWKNRAGNEKGGRNITGEVIASATPPGLWVCGQYITDSVDAMQAMCISVSGYPKRQLVRQLTAGMLNCRLGICSIEHTTMLATCNTVCENEVVAGYQDCIDEIDCFNNGGIWNGAMCIYGTGECAVTGEDCSDVNPCPALPDGSPQACVPDPTCHDDGNLCEEGAEFCFEPPGRNSSPKQCKQLQDDGIYFPYPSG